MHRTHHTGSSRSGRRTRQPWLSLLLAAGLGVGGARVAAAHVSPVDLQVAARALSFLQPPMGGAIRVGIVYAAGNAESEAEAAELQQMMEAGFKTGNVELTPMLVRLNELSTAHVGLYFLTSGLGASAAAVGTASANAHVPCVTIDLSQVQGGTCVMGVRNSPKVEILVNRAAAVHAGIAFSAVFRMMIIEL